VKTGLEHVSSQPVSAPMATPVTNRKGCNIWTGLLVGVCLFCLLGIGVPFLSYFFHQKSARRQAVATQMGDTLSLVGTSVAVDPVIRSSPEAGGSLRIESPQGAVITVAEIDDAKATSGGRILCNALLRCQNTPGGAHLDMYVETTNGSLLTSKQPAQMVGGTQDWQPIYATVDLKPGTQVARVWVNAVVQGPGTLWVDEIVVSHEPNPQ
jgi:hypothetical protein